MEPWAEIAAAAHTAGMLMRDCLVASGRWEVPPAGEQAAVHCAMATGHVLVTTPQRHWNVDEDGARLCRLAETACHVADLSTAGHAKNASVTHVVPKTSAFAWRRCHTDGVGKPYIR